MSDPNWGVTPIVLIGIGLKGAVEMRTLLTQSLGPIIIIGQDNGAWPSAESIDRASIGESLIEDYKKIERELYQCKIDYEAYIINQVIYEYYIPLKKKPRTGVRPSIRLTLRKSLHPT